MTHSHDPYRPEQDDSDQAHRDSRQSASGGAPDAQPPAAPYGDQNGWGGPPAAPGYGQGGNAPGGPAPSYDAPSWGSAPHAGAYEPHGTGPGSYDPRQEQGAQQPGQQAWDPQQNGYGGPHQDYGQTQPPPQDYGQQAQYDQGAPDQSGQQGSGSGSAAPIVWNDNSSSGTPAWSGPAAHGGAAPAAPAAPQAPEAPAQPWVNQGAAPTAHEVHQDWMTARDPQSEPVAAPPAPPAPAYEQQAAPPAPAAPAWGDAPQAPAQQPVHDAGQWGAQPPAQPEAPQWGAPPAQPDQASYGASAAPAAPQAPPAPPAAPDWGQQPAQQQPYDTGHAAPPESQPLAPDEAAEALPTQMTPAVSAPPEGEEPAEEALSIGRGRTNSIVLDDMLVSRQHVRITVDDQGLVIEDLGSRNGTFVNGRRVERTHLHEGDRIGIGASTFEVRDGWLVSI